MKRALSTAAVAISVLFAGPSADAFVPRGAMASCSPKIQNPNHRIIITADHMPCNPAASYSTRSKCSMLNDNSPDVFSRREAMDITLGAMTGWILGPRVTFAATATSGPDATPGPDDEDWPARPYWTEMYELLLQYNNEIKLARVNEKHSDGDAAVLAAWVARRK
mmetsp:Transcript_5247/g.8916  ORF Transcript_5247/g.8916 Transcript_5247/m.8916 type:complete len:165 (-) Transcript_5247:214-708(-)|eukprot:CAMPEP_0197725966 /NCGR_PEP_ID=MMETSP1434-20131217/12371_1 /TAXON_ID=265543 /ORGANISM="Minutocellus polymorphus, Strain CCMP3303" /LENGTH=164 /DNA_ID=CAMNT_0043311721 /DNA_START=42 /DNA_END=536 /DNA_ORIENTATION=+